MRRVHATVWLVAVILIMVGAARADLISVDTSQSTLTMEATDTAGDSGLQTVNVSTFPFIQSLGAASPDGNAIWDYEPNLTDTELDFQNYGNSRNGSEATYSTLGAHIIFTANGDLAFEVGSWGVISGVGSASYELSLTDQDTATVVFDGSQSGAHPVFGGDGTLEAGHSYDLEFTGSLTTEADGNTPELSDDTYVSLTPTPEPACASVLAVGAVLLPRRRRGRRPYTRCGFGVGL